MVEKGPIAIKSTKMQWDRSIFLCNKDVLYPWLVLWLSRLIICGFLPTPRKGNVFRGVCLFTGIGAFSEVFVCLFKLGGLVAATAAVGIHPTGMLLYFPELHVYHFLTCT